MPIVDKHRRTRLFFAGLLCILGACNPLGSRSTIGGGDGTGPTASVVPALTSPTLVRTNPFTVTLSWNTPVTGFSLADLSMLNGTPSAFSGSGADYSFVVTPTADGDVTINIDEGAARDLSGIDSTATTLTITYDGSGPTLTLNKSVSQAEITATLPASFRAVFDEVIDPTTFTDADITQSGSATGVTWTVTNLGDDKTFSVTATAVSGIEGSLYPTLSAGSVTDVAGNSNSASTATSGRVIYFSNCASVRLWLRADTLAYANGASVVTWSDSSSFANNCSEATNPPTYFTSAQNGLGVVRFSGGSAILRSNSLSAITGNPDFTLFTVARVNGTGTNYPVFVQIGEDSNTGTSVYFGLEGTTAGLYTGFYGGGSKSAVTTPAGFNIYSYVRDSASGTNGTQTGNSQYWNGSSATVTTSLSAAAVNIVNGYYRIGRSTVNTTLNGDLGEIIVFGTALTNAQRSAVENYLNNKWVIY